MEAQGIPDTVVKQVSEHHGEILLCWRSEEEGRVSASLTIQIHQQPLLVVMIQGILESLCSSTEMRVCPETAAHKWRCFRTSKSDGIIISFFFSLFTSALQSHSWLPKQEVPSWLFVNNFYSLHALRAARRRVYGFMCWLAVIYRLAKDFQNQKTRSEMSGDTSWEFISLIPHPELW